MGLSALIGGVKKVTEFEVSSPVANDTWQSVDVTSAGVTDIDKMELNLLTSTGSRGDTGAGGGHRFHDLSIRIASATSVQYRLSTTAEATDPLVFQVINHR